MFGGGCSSAGAQVWGSLRAYVFRNLDRFPCRPVWRAMPTLPGLVGRLFPVAVSAFGDLATGYCLAGFQPATQEPLRDEPGRHR